MNYKVLKEMPRAKVGDVLVVDNYGDLLCETTIMRSSPALSHFLVQDAITEGFITPIDEEVVKTELPELLTENVEAYSHSTYLYGVAKNLNQINSYLKEME